MPAKDVAGFGAAAGVCAAAGLALADEACPALDPAPEGFEPAHPDDPPVVPPALQSPVVDSKSMVLPGGCVMEMVAVFDGAPAAEPTPAPAAGVGEAAPPLPADPLPDAPLAPPAAPEPPPDPEPLPAAPVPTVPDVPPAPAPLPPLDPATVPNAVLTSEELR